MQTKAVIGLTMLMAAGASLAGISRAEAAEGVRWRVRANAVPAHIARMDANRDGWVTHLEAAEAKKKPAPAVVRRVSRRSVQPRLLLASATMIPMARPFHR